MNFATDLEKLSNLFTEFGIKFIEKEESSLEAQKVNNCFTTIECDQGDDKVKGMTGATTIFEFDSDGKFVCMGAYVNY